MKDVYKTYSLSIKLNIRGSIVSISWDEEFSRKDIKGCFYPEDTSFGSLIMLPDIFSSEDEKVLTEQEKTDIETEAFTQIAEFEAETVYYDSFDIWLEDLEKEFLSLKGNLPSVDVLQYEEKYSNIMGQINSCEIEIYEGISFLYALVKKMKAQTGQ